MRSAELGFFGVEVYTRVQTPRRSGQDFKAGDCAGVFGRLPLRVVKVGGDGDDGPIDGFTEKVLGGLLHLLQNHSRNFRRAEFVIVYFYDGLVARSLRDIVRNLAYFRCNFFIPSSHKPLDGEDGLCWISDGLTLGRLADQALILFAKADH